MHTILLDLCSVDICCTVTGFHAAFVGGVLRVLDEMNLYTASHSVIDRVFFVT